MANYILNTKSGFLHLSDSHGGDPENSMEFDRIDAADLFVHREMRSKLEFCQQCFPLRAYAIKESVEPEPEVERVAPENLPTHADLLENDKEDE